ncbi:MAG TPA: hypothetical protein ENH94_11455 [Phycisphaerales bacterium]|nr:hypothetical protein [Phycisphaerales bacterium]
MTERKRKRCWRCGLYRLCRIYERDRNPRAAVDCEGFRWSVDNDISGVKRMVELIANNSERILPTAITLISIGAAVGYAIKGDFGRAMYWVCAAGLTGTVTFLVR